MHTRTQTNRLIIPLLLLTAILPLACTSYTEALKTEQTYTSDNVVAIAKELNPECRLQEVDPTCNCRKDTYSYADPVFSANVTGNGVWEVNKTCPINSAWNGSWYFYEDTGELVVKQVNRSDNATASKPVISDNTTKIETGTEIGMRAPDFILNKLDGTPVKLSEYQGKTVLLDFWISTCPSCKKKLAILQEFYENTSREKIEVLGVNVQEYESWAARFVESQKLTMPILLDTDSAVTKLYKVKGLPTLVIIDIDGNIYKKDANFESLEELEDLLP
ncbi:MAG: hypothetical protein A2Z02_06285 [Chloroflexi bacterium RBG_16_48_7]|nr:MAG: hypothetical protein A2Z02_06285 [Chloroflexi bacterium RBG_16_48_7]